MNIQYFRIRKQRPHGRLAGIRRVNRLHVDAVPGAQVGHESGGIGHAD